MERLWLPNFLQLSSDCCWPPNGNLSSQGGENPHPGFPPGLFYLLHLRWELLTKAAPSVPLHTGKGECRSFALPFYGAIYASTWVAITFRNVSLFQAPKSQFLHFLILLPGRWARIYAHKLARLILFAASFSVAFWSIQWKCLLN